MKEYGLKCIDNCRFLQASLLDLTDNLSDKFYIQNVLNVDVEVKNVNVLIKNAKIKNIKIKKMYLEPVKVGNVTIFFKKI